MVEQERKYAVPAAFRLPDLSPALPSGGRVDSPAPVTLVATYFDTADLRLARAGVSLRHREGDEPPWTVKLPTTSPGVRHEISRPGATDTVPAELAELVTAYHRGAPLVAVALVSTVRDRRELRDGDGGLLAEVVEDRVTSVAAGGATGTVDLSFREVEVERGSADADLLDRVEALLTTAGARLAEFVPKHVKALGKPARRAPDLVGPGELPAEPTAGDVVTEAIRRGVRRILRYDPLVRLGEEAGDVEAVRKMRVGTRRLRSDLRTFAPLLDAAWADPLADQLRWLAGVLGEARDVEVLRDRLRRTAAADPVDPLDAGALDRLDAALAARQRQATTAVADALRSPRYLALVESLVVADRAPRLTPKADTPAEKALPRLVRKPWRRLAHGTGRHGGVPALDPLGPDEQWHDVRKAAKRVRYALEAVAPVLGAGAGKLARAVRESQALLGAHQDAAVAAETWTALALAHPDDPTLAVTAGRLAERERAEVRRARADLPDTWRRAVRRRKGWLT
ncbi:CYTH and CHAD domain-containing protein [Micromonospora sagamiensis]|uniref:CHAD domain-containing protein n=1 Tax=Micromonospora sagamiensis TaxID=47875 RepID=A0A562WL66_9ACTN|nr:CYTH and CHAD domain-containing protein [Micromonospora sagamiensis]TWJ30791.1 CHAD domain-containing protein [Micromonospora sagamiensis]BCL16173.1 CHAD domain-containing protein [Micromonospora sagamiensis]